MSSAANSSPDDLAAMRDSIRIVLQLLIQGEWTGLERMTGGRRLSAEELEAAVVEYGRTLIPIPDQELANVGFIEVTGPKWRRLLPPPRRRQFYAMIPLWTREEGQSDLSLELTLIEEMEGVFAVEVDNIRVM